tara:strand:- start:295 stop:471 length:177 start_codon:yes stop_codon:yes gene_type:complete
LDWYFNVVRFSLSGGKCGTTLLFADWSFDRLSTLHSVEKISFGLLEKNYFLIKVAPSI